MEGVWTEEEIMAARKEATALRKLLLGPEDHDQGESGNGDSGEYLNGGMGI